MRRVIKKIKKTLINHLPPRLKAPLVRRLHRKRLWINYRYDMERYLNNSGMRELVFDYHYLSRIIAHYHVLEKGLAMPECRIGFGEGVALSLTQLLKTYVEKSYDTCNVQFVSALKVLQAYVDFHRKSDHPMAAVEAAFAPLAALLDDRSASHGGIVEISSGELKQAAQGDFRSLSRSRHSIRNYAPGTIPDDDIREAVGMAQWSPSACNRQSCKVYVVSQPEMKQAVLELQSGNRGFGHLADKVLVVTSDMRAFIEIGERYQTYIDSGMFGMSLLYALHYKGLGACTLNWSVEHERDRQLHELLAMPDYEVISMLISVGRLPDPVKHARSQRKLLDDVAIFL